MSILGCGYFARKESRLTFHHNNACCSYRFHYQLWGNKLIHTPLPASSTSTTIVDLRVHMLHPYNSFLPKFWNFIVSNTPLQKGWSLMWHPLKCLWPGSRNLISGNCSWSLDHAPSKALWSDNSRHFKRSNGSHIRVGQRKKMDQQC